MERSKKEEYWHCQIGPIKRGKVPPGGDYPLRNGVEKVFIKMFGKQAEICSSGWGLTEEMKSRFSMIDHLRYTDPSGKVMEKIDKILNAHQEKLIKIESKIKSKIKNKECYRLTFDDKKTVECDDEHYWTLSNNLVVQSPNLKVGMKIDVALPIENQEISLPIDPYVLGLS